MKQLLILLIAANFFSADCNAQQGKYKKKVALKTGCIFEGKNRKITDSICNEIATVSKKGSSVLLTIKGKKYLPCNLPDNFKSSTILITGYILQSFQTVKLVGTPLKITKAYVL